MFVSSSSSCSILHKVHPSVVSYSRRGAMDSRLHRIFAGGGAGGGPHPDSPLVDSSEQVYISSLALLKMLKHGTF